MWARCIRNCVINNSVITGEHGKERILEFQQKYPEICYDWQKIRNKLMNTIYKEKKELRTIG